VATFAVGTDAFLIAGILPAIAADLGVSISAAGQLVSAYALTYAVGSPILAALGGRLAPRRLIVLAMITHALGNTLCAVAPSYAVLLVGRMLAGAGAAMATPTAYLLASHMAPAHRQGAALGAAAMGLATSTMVGVPLGVWAARLWGWHAGFWLVGGCSSFALLALLAGGLPAVRSAGTLALKARLAPLGRPRVLLTILPQLVWTTGGFVTYTYVAPFLDSTGIPAAWLPALLLVYGTGCVLGTQMGGRLRDRFGLRIPLLCCLAAGALNQALLAWAGGNLALTALAFLVWPLISWAVWAPQQGRLIACEPENPGVVLALANSVVYASAALAAVVGAALLPVIGFAGLPVLGTLLYATALGLVWRLDPAG